MEAAFGASDSRACGVEGADEVCEAAQVLFLRRFGSAMRAKAGTRMAMLAKRLPGWRRSCRPRPAAARRAGALRQRSGAVG